MEYVAQRRRNPFELDPPCEGSVSGYGDVNAHFHVVGDHPGVHGGTATGIPFTGRPWSGRFFDALERGGLVDAFDLEAGTLDCPGTFLSYLSMCAPGTVDTAGGDGDGADTEGLYARLEPYFDAELRAITAHVLLPVGPRATAHVLATYTSLPADRDIEQLHATPLSGSGWLVLPVADPAEWADGDGARLADALRDLRERDYRQQSDLGRFIPGGEPYLVR